MSSIITTAIEIAERGYAPDMVMAAAIRWSCRNRLRTVQSSYQADPNSSKAAFLSLLDAASIAVATGEANEQHYELPADFFGTVLGPNRKYSGCEWSDGVDTLEQAETAALNTIVKRAQLSSATRILELGCGWGSLTLHMAARYPDAHITAVSNSTSQRAYIMSEATRRGLVNIDVITADINSFAPEGKFDRIVTVEMLEHVRNYRALFGRLASWLTPEGLMFAHIFRHRLYSYTFETEGSGNWMGQHFFTGGIMPGHDLLLEAQSSLTLKERWVVEGVHYARTADAWLKNMDCNRVKVQQILAAHYGDDNAIRWFNRWRMFFMACRELFGYSGGNEWGVSHYLFGHPV